MKTLIVIFFLSLTFGLISCSQKNEVVQIGENTFVYNQNVYKVIDNKTLLVTNLKTDTISTIKEYNIERYGKSKWNAPYGSIIIFPIHNLDVIKNGASCQIKITYIAHKMYFKFFLIDLPDLRENFTHISSFTIRFENKEEFVLFTVDIPVNELVRMDVSTADFRYDGSIEMDEDSYTAIDTYKLGYTRN